MFTYSNENGVIIACDFTCIPDNDSRNDDNNDDTAPLTVIMIMVVQWKSSLPKVWMPMLFSPSDQKGEIKHFCMILSFHMPTLKNSSEIRGCNCYQSSEEKNANIRSYSQGSMHTKKCTWRIVIIPSQYKQKVINLAGNTVKKPYFSPRVYVTISLKSCIYLEDCVIPLPLNNWFKDLEKWCLYVINWDSTTIIPTLW